MHQLYPFILFLLLPTTFSQDISFPSSSQDTTNQDTEYIQAQHTIPEVSFAPQAMTEYQPGGGGLLGGDVSGGVAGGYGGGVAGGVTDLGLAIHRVARNQGGQQYWVYSPTSIASALYMVLLGSNGKTFTELSHLLGVTSSSLKPHEDFSASVRTLQYTGNEKNIVKLANGLFVQADYSIRDDYRDITSSLYQSTLQSLDFRNNASLARDVINSWVAEKTLGKITEILENTPSPETKIVLANSLYFKGEWAKPFPSELTKLQNFFPDGRYQPTKLKVPMMATQGSYRYYHDKHLNCEVVGIPYKGEAITFYLILPHNSNKEKLKTLEDQLSHGEFQRLADNAVLTDDVIVAMPKMKLSSEYLLKSVLQELGVRALFDPREADLSLVSSASNAARPSSGPFEEEDRFIFTRMKNFNRTGEERRRRSTTQQIVPEKSMIDRKRRLESNSRSKRLTGDQPNDLQFPQAFPRRSPTDLNNEPSLDQKSPNRRKRQVKPETPSLGLLPLGRNDNTLEPSRRLRNLANPGLYVSKIIHKVVVDVNEKGTEAAATTAVSMVKTVSHTVKADAPFLFFIRHELTQMVMFWGSVVIPPGSS